MALQAPFPWFGGKRRVAADVWARFGNTPNYVEPFAGSLAVLLGRPHVGKTETVNDLDGFIANFWRAVSAAPDETARWADWPVNENDAHARQVWLVNQRATLEARLSGGRGGTGDANRHRERIYFSPACESLSEGLFDIEGASCPTS